MNWAEQINNNENNDTNDGNGIAFQRSEVELNEVTDGLTNTIMVAEKFIEPARYETTGHGDHHGGYVFYWDTWRYVGSGEEQIALQDANLGNTLIMRDVNGCCVARMGSAHPGGMNAVMCDGSVQTISYDIDPITYSFLGARDDGNVFNESPF